MAAEAVLLLLRVPLKRDLNGDGIVTAEENAEVDELSRKVRRRIVGTVTGCVPCIVMTAGSIGSRSGREDGLCVTETRASLRRRGRGFKDYTVAVETSTTEGDEVEREVVAHVTTSQCLGRRSPRSPTSSARC